MSECWKPIEGWPYEVSDLGRVRRTVSRGSGKAGQIIQPFKSKRGYLVFRLSHDCKRRFSMLSRLVLEAHIGPPPTPRHQANHKNGVRTDNRLKNLEWRTPSGNVRHARDELSLAQQKLTLGEASMIRFLAVEGRISQTEIARLFGVGQSHVSRIKSGDCWAAQVA
jgi:NUMOD4 motif/HNH endonuclease